MKNSTARTGLALERDLYLLAQKKAAEHGQSFAEYAISLIAHDLIDHPDGERSAKIRQLRADRARFLNPAKAWEEVEAKDTRGVRRELRDLGHKVASKRPGSPAAA